MSREIKFRAWIKDTDEMKLLSGINFSSREVNHYWDKEDISNYDYSNFEEVQIMQYTGLKDKNGVEVYEGDIVNVHWFYANHDPETLGVYEDETNLECVEIIGVRGALGFYFEDDFLPLAFVPTHEESFEVIGNVYEDKELLEVE